MKNKTWIFLTVLICVLLAVVFAGVHALYSGIAPGNTPKDVMPVYSDEELLAMMDPEEPQQKSDASYDFPTSTGVEEPQPAPKEQKKTPAKTQEFKVKNFRTGKMNTLSQNLENNKLQLLDHEGKSQWTVKLANAICGPVAEVDNLYKGKIQFLVAEGSKLHVFDLKGNEVKGYPKTLPSKIKKGPVKAQKNKKACWKIETANGTVHFDVKEGKTI